MSKTRRVYGRRSGIIILRFVYSKADHGEHVVTHSTFHERNQCTLRRFQNFTKRSSSLACRKRNTSIFLYSPRHAPMFPKIIASFHVDRLESSELQHIRCVLGSFQKGKKDMYNSLLDLFLLISSWYHKKTSSLRHSSFCISPPRRHRNIRYLAFTEFSNNNAKARKQDTYLCPYNLFRNRRKPFSMVFDFQILQQARKYVRKKGKTVGTQVNFICCCQRDMLTIGRSEDAAPPHIVIVLGF